MNTYTPESINKPNTYNVGGKDYKVEGYITADDTETGEQFFVPLVDIPKPFFRGRGRRLRTLGTRFWSGCLTAKSRLLTAFSSLLSQIFNKTECF